MRMPARLLARILAIAAAVALSAQQAAAQSVLRDAETLSRYRTAKQRREVQEGLQRGNVDIVVGTHQLSTPSLPGGRPSISIAA